MACYLLGIYLLLALCVLQSSSGTTAKEITCQEISVPLCKGIGYNYTYMPNQFNHDTQDEAGLEVHQFWPLVEIQCSPDLKFFLCSMYTPICLEDYKKPLPPCRSVCERARAGCAPLMRQYGFPWPDRMRCDLLPVQGTPDTLCMDYNRTDSTTVSPVLSKPTNYPVGITSGVWIWSGKTLESWRTFCTRCCWGTKGTSGSMYSDVSTGLTWRSGTASSVSCPKQMPLSQV
ncbi:frizzled-8a isoform X2 [Clupea harengus]|uniref:Frizzled-8a isoform X2 n=1 Tax=Clupea harengus TaxID=7950 RepID=A0A6P8GLS3_CLUHA|nr:frizzled-8a isoform X2 [Clupea harengus]